MLQFYTNKMHRQSNESKMSLKYPPKCPPILFGRTKCEDWEDSSNPDVEGTLFN